MSKGTDVLIVGGGIVGMAHAVAARRKGLSVRLIERSASPMGASIRNFGMIWPIGQVRGEGLAHATRSREVWLELGDAAGFPIRECGSLHLAYAEDELAVLQEFVEAERGVEGRAIELLDGAQTCEGCDAVKPDGLIGSLHSTTELGMDPREAVSKIFAWLGRDCDVVQATAVGIDGSRVTTSDGAVFEASRVIVCSGADLQTLYPALLAQAPMRLCKLQMMRTGAQPDGWRLTPHLAAGLTLCHYAAFASCPSQKPLRERLDREFAEHRAQGVHVLATQNHLGELVLGDSHHYGAAAETPFDSEFVNRLVLDYLRGFLVAPDLSIAATWSGVYAKMTDGRLVFIDEPEDGVTVVTGLGGGGMTLALSIAEGVIDAVVSGRSAHMAAGA